jgi:hypothetical protein
MLDGEMTTAKKDLGHLSVFDLLRRDWKGDIRRAPDSHSVHLGLASVPTSLQDMINRTESKKIDEYFNIESDFTVSIAVCPFSSLSWISSDVDLGRRQPLLDELERLGRQQVPRIDPGRQSRPPIERRTGPKSVREDHQGCRG